MLGSPGAVAQTFFRFPKLGKVEVRCRDSDWTALWTSPNGVAGYWQLDGTGPGEHTASMTGDGGANIVSQSDEQAAQITIQVGKIATSKVATVLMTVAFDDENDDCYVNGHATTEGGVAIHVI
jgi:hypothetical protein